MVVYSGDTNRSAVLYDSLRADSVPFEGVISDGSSIRIDFLAQEPAATTAFNIRFEGAVSPCWGQLSQDTQPQGAAANLGLQEGCSAQCWCPSVVLVVI